MAFKFFIVPIQDSGPAEAELNGFLASHKVLSVDRRWVEQGASSFWALCVDYIGSLTSQHLANFYLGWFDRFVKEKLRVPGYVRYMDDMAVWCGAASELTTILHASRAFLRDELQLEIKEVPYINRTTHGMDFLGCRVFRQRLTLNRRSRVRFRRKLRRLEDDFLGGRMGDSELQHVATALVAFTRTPGLSNWRWRRSVIEQLPVSGPGARTG